MTIKRKQLEQAIAAQEQLRGMLPDAVVDTAIAAIKAQLQALEPVAVSPPQERRKHITVLFADVSGFTAMSEKLDAEEACTPRKSAAHRFAEHQVAWLNATIADRCV